MNSRHQIAQSVLENDYFRRPELVPGAPPGHKEWLHFAVHASGLDLLVNFSVVDDVRPGAAFGAELPRITTLVRTDHWSGDIDEFDRRDVSVRGGHVDLSYGENFVRFVDGAFEIFVRMRRQPIEVRLRLVPVVLPNQASTLQVPGCPPVHWVAVPRLLASGSVHYRGQRHAFEGALAYHDHNWGYWRWGSDFAWEWGYGVPDDPEHPWTLIFVRLTDRRHLTDLAQSVFLWRGARQFRFFRPDELTVQHEGLLAPGAVLKLPSVMALAKSGKATDIPKKLIVSARGPTDHIDFTFTSEDVAQVIIPNDDDLGVTIINEVSGRIDAEGEVAGEPINIHANTIFEFLSD